MIERTGCPSTDPIDVNITNQPIDVNVISSIPLPAGAATEATLLTVLTTAAFQARVNTLGQKLMSASTPVVISSDQSVIPVSNANLSNIDVLLSTRATEATLATMLTLAGFQSRINTLGQKTMANSTPIVLASDQSSIPVTATISGSPNVTVVNAAGASAVNIQDGGNSITIDATSLPLPTGAATETTLLTLLTTTAFQARINTLGQKTMANSTPVVLASDQSVIPVSQSGTWNINNISGTISLPTGAATEVTLATMLTLAGFQARINTLGQKTMANSTPVVIASDQSTINVTPSQIVSSTATTSNATITNVSSTALAANANRKMVTIYNDAGRNVYIRFGGAASTTSFTIKMSDGSYYELPQPTYTGALHAITSVGSGDIRITELT